MDTRVTVVILAAGLGTRMKSRRAKVLHQAGGKTLIEHTVDFDGTGGFVDCCWRLISSRGDDH